MSWKGTFFGALIGLVLARGRIWGVVIGAIIGQMLEQSFVARRAPGGAPRPATGQSSRSIADEFFRTTFELMGHVAKSDGRVSEAEIDAARRLMQELRLGPREISAAIDCFRNGKSTVYDAEVSVERLREACGMRYDLLRAFMELQLRAALAGNGMSPPARAILTRVAERLGMSGLEFAHLEASLRARRRAYGTGDRDAGDRHSGAGDRHSGAGDRDAGAGDRDAGAGDRDAGARRTSLAEFYSELEIGVGSTDQEVTLAYRRQMSRHHPDKLVANGLPESMAQVAKEKTQRIQEAYEEIRAARGMR